MLVSWCVLLLKIPSSLIGPAKPAGSVRVQFSALDDAIAPALIVSVFSQSLPDISSGFGGAQVLPSMPIATLEDVEV